MVNGDWGFGGWGVVGGGGGGWGLGAAPHTPNPKSPIPNPQSPIFSLYIFNLLLNQFKKLIFDINNLNQNKK